jgi:Fungal domain of unknown function (DUF1750)
MANPSLDQIIQFLRTAPHIAKEAKPVSWKLIAPPNTGDMFLEYIAKHRESQFASDGYVWIDAERYMERDLQEYVSLSRLGLLHL